ncbi:hypothetical protein BH09PSE5_BH09PSE5_06990 [soil metagenome]
MSISSSHSSQKTEKAVLKSWARLMTQPTRKVLDKKQRKIQEW